ncbi:hypothetical protein D8Y20_10865 [Mariprofundus sp. EBB-1]|uniref:sulfotransferase family 2 domain-containing protein n=1 Tax=Mariprofundus sp. EBB-1 TaxID=2650971 RepID=UPI000EF20B9A|nr:sulfotransferase family 2 domain-containing protein [Mariprofundus sp. EBB-1]RLL50883.1 hypothetical protein D8Y20_10865 [Mariprofundus sp. EBB-1]
MVNFCFKKNKKLLPVVFLHIQKTAGSSIVDLARKYYGDSVISHGDYSGIRAECFQKVNFVSGHFGYEFARHLMPGRFSFTFLRDPVQRVLSFYHYCKKQNPNDFEPYRLAQELSIEGFLEYALKPNTLKTAVCNNQAWQLAHGYGHGTDRNYYSFGEAEMQDLAVAHLEKLSHVGFTETFEDDRSFILTKLGIPVPEVNEITNASGYRPSVNDLSGLAVELLEEVTRIDQTLYSYAWSIRKP